MGREVKLKDMTYDKAYTKHQSKKRGLLRSIIRNIYLLHTSKYAKGKTIDFGCGAGELLKKLPQDSIGLEVNENTVKYCRDKGLNVICYNPRKDDYQFKSLGDDVYKTFIISHVLEHLENPAEVLDKIFKSSYFLKIDRIIVVVPGFKGFNSHKTHHVTYVDYDYLEKNNLCNCKFYKIIKKEYFPFNFSWAGNYFTYNEMIVIYDRV